MPVPATGQYPTFVFTFISAEMIPDYVQILEMGSEREVADLAVKTMEEYPGSMRQMIDLCAIDEYPVSMRAARALQLYCEKHPGEIYPFLDEVVEMAISANIEGVRRNFLKVFAEFIDISRISDPGPLLGKCFDWLADGRIKPGTRIHAMGIIFKLAQDEPELLNELKATIELAMEEGEISIRTCGRKMTGKISRQLELGRRRSAVNK